MAHKDHPYSSQWRRIRKVVIRRDNGLCQHCTRKGRTTIGREVHHIVRLSDGGTDDLDNLVLLCKECHHAETMRERGHRVKQKVRFDKEGRPIWQ